MKISKTKLGMAMAERGYNFTRLSEKCGVSRTTLSYINNGKVCRPDILFKIAKALGVQPQEILEEE